MTSFELHPSLSQFRDTLVQLLQKEGAHYDLCFQQDEGQSAVYEMDKLENLHHHDHLSLVYRIIWPNQKVSVGSLETFQIPLSEWIKTLKMTATELPVEDVEALLKKVPTAPGDSQSVVASLPPFLDSMEALQNQLKKDFQQHYDLAYIQLGVSFSKRYLTSSQSGEWSGVRDSYNIMGYLQSKHLDIPRSYHFELSRPLNLSIQWDDVYPKWVREAQYQLNLSDEDMSNRPVILSSYAILQLLYAFSNIFDAWAISQNESLVKPHEIGTRLTSEMFCLSDDPAHRWSSHFPVDMEGVSRKALSLLENGVLRHVLTSKMSAQRLQQSLTGHGSLGLRPASTPLFLRVCPSADGTMRSLEEWINEGGVYIHSLHSFHSGCKPLQGHFSLPCQGWRRTASGIQSFSQVVLVGDIFRVLRSIIGFSQEREICVNGEAHAVVTTGAQIVQRL